MSKKRNKPSDQGPALRGGKILFSGLIGLVLTTLLTFSAALAITRELLPLECTKWMGTVIVGLSAFFTAVIASRRNGKKLLCGLLSALVYGSGMLICGLLLFSAPMEMGRMLLSLAALLAGTIAGVFISGMQG